MKPWSEQINVLIDLQKIDIEIFDLEKELSQKPEQKKFVEEAFEKQKADLKIAEDALKTLKMNLKERENDLSSKEQGIKKFEGQQMLVKTNKEYSALTQEIKTLKADCSLYEDDILRIMDEIDKGKKKVESETKILGEKEEIKKKTIAEITSRSKEIEDKLTARRSEREQFVPKTDKSTLVQYDKILKKREGKAIAAVNGLTCGACHITLTHQTVNEIKIKDKMIQCESCQRILYDSGN